jgi:HK97 gp10 family phage protein
MFDPFCREKAQEIYEASQDLVPVDTGALKESGHIEEVGSAVGEGLWYVVYDAPTKDQSKWKSYAIFLELGTSKMSAQPYLRPAMEQVIGKL